MTTRVRVLRLYVGALALAAAVVLTFAGARHHLGSDAALVVGYTVLLGLTTALPPVLLLKQRETEALQFEELFFVAMALTLRPADALLGFGVGIFLGHLARRRAAIKTIFNVAQEVLAAAAGLAVFDLIGAAAIPGPREAAGAVAGAAVFWSVNLAAFVLVLHIAEGRSVGASFRERLGLRVAFAAANVSLGLLVGLVSSTQRWAWPFAVVPAVLLHLAFRGHQRAARAEQRANGLLTVAAQVHASIGLAEVRDALERSAASLLAADRAELRMHPPVAGELGVRTEWGGREHWLVVGGRRGYEPFDIADQQLLDAIAATTRSALENAQLFEQVAVERKKLSDVVGSSSDGILSVDADQRISSWNAAMERITGFAAADVVGSKCFTVYRPRDEEGRELCPAACPGRCGRNAEPQSVQVTTINGEQRWLSCTYSPLPDGGYVVVARDMTAQKAVDDLKADFLATISHELRTPLTPIQGFLHTLLREDTHFSDAERRRFYEVMLRQSERLERLVKDLLEATSLQDRDHLFLPEEVDWARVIAHVGELFNREHPDRELLVELPDDAPVVVADEQRAEQILLNLLANAAKYSPAGTPVRITVEVLGDEVVTTVADRGPGIPPADRDRIFERFTRLGDHLTRRVGGAGLGLFIARRLVEGMGGSITVGQAPEGGAAFSFSLPQYTGARQTR